MCSGTAVLKVESRKSKVEGRKSKVEELGVRGKELILDIESRFKIGTKKRWMLAPPQVD